MGFDSAGACLQFWRFPSLNFLFRQLMEFGCFVLFANEVIHELPRQLKGGLDLN